MAGINELRQKVESDEAFREALEKAADMNEYMNTIKEAGFDVTVEEIANALKDSRSGELDDDDDLDNVAGGFSVPPCSTLCPITIPSSLQPTPGSTEDFEHGDTSIGEGAFSRCGSLQTIPIPISPSMQKWLDELIKKGGR